MTTVRTRIAPSPTGDPHVGTAYIGLFNFVFAKAFGGEFIIRIEDTDQKRSTEISEQAIFEALRWVGLSWDEGPDVGGKFGPYRQSERRDLYRTYCQKLIDQNHAFRCFCTPEELEVMRQQQIENGEIPKYDGRHAHLSEDEIKTRLANGEPYVVRMRVPEDGECKLFDRLRGEILIPWSQIDMQVLLKADGLPTYHLANVIDDHLMGITHVIRGEEWIPSSPKHFLLYQYFNWQMPELCHLPLLRNPDKTKLSKRKNPTSILYYKAQGFLPEALLNYLGRMGWSMPDGREHFDLEDMIKAFDIDRISLGGPIFDIKKLNWLNAEWLKYSLSEEEFRQRFTSWLTSDELMRPLVPHLRSRIQVFSDAYKWIKPLWQNDAELTRDMLADVDLERLEVSTFFQYLSWQFDSLKQWDRDSIYRSIQRVCEVMGVKLKQVMPLVFLALSGSRDAISAFDLASMLGPDRTRIRMRQALEIFGGLSKKELKRLKKTYQAAFAESLDS